MPHPQPCLVRMMHSFRTEVTWLPAFAVGESAQHGAHSHSDRTNQTKTQWCLAAKSYV